MRNILDAQTKRLVEIIEHLTLSQYSDLPTIMDLIDASDKTVLSDLNYIEKNWGKELGMVKYRDVFYFEQKNSAIMHHIFRDLFSKSLPILLTMELFENPHQGMKFYSSKLHVSESSLYRLLPNLEKYLLQSNINIQNHHGLYSLNSANECHFRHFITSLYLQTQYIDDIMKHKELEVLNKILDSFFEYYDPGSDMTGRSFYLLYYKFALRREIQGFKGPFDSDVAVDFAFEILNPKVENLSLAHLKSAHGGFVKMFVPHEESHNEIQALKNSMIQALSLDLSEKESDIMYRLCADAYTYINFYPYEVASLFNRHQHFTQSFKSQNEKTYALIEKTIQEYADENSKIFELALEYFVYYLNVYFYRAIRKNQKINIVIISELGKEHANFLQEYLHDHFADTNVKTEDIYSLSLSRSSAPFDVSKYDLILSTGILDNLEPEDYLIINDYPSVLDLARIKSNIQKSYVRV